MIGSAAAPFTEVTLEQNVLTHCDSWAAVMLLPAGFLAITVLNWPGRGRRRNWVWIAVAFVLIWGAYRFSFGPMTEHVARDAAEQGGVFAKIP